MLRLAIRHADLKRIEKSERNRRPEILDADKVQQDEPAVLFPYLAPQLADEMGFSKALRARDIVRRNIRLKLSSIIRIIPALENASSLSGDSFTGVAFTL